MSSIARSKAFTSLPERKKQQALALTIKACEDCSQRPIVSLSEACDKCGLINKAKLRFADSNVPLKYWDLKMEEFQGPANLSSFYESMVKDLSQTYLEGKSFCLEGPHGIGKQIALDTEIPTPTGFIKLIDLKEGDQLFDENGDICNVVKLHPIDLAPESYKVIFDDGSEVEACADHLWLTHTRQSRVAEQLVRDGKRKFTNLGPKVRSTKEIIETLHIGGKQRISNHSIPCTKPVNYKEKKLLIDPYVLGCWLGDGASNGGSLETADWQILDELKKQGYANRVRKSSVDNGSASNGSASNTYRINGLSVQLKELGLINNKHIPDVYLRGSFEQRLSLLQGLLDTDGHCKNSGGIEISSSYPELAKGIHELILSLGIKCNIKCQKAGYLQNGVYKKCQDRYRMAFTTQLPVFRLKNKLKNIRVSKSQLTRTTHRFIVDVVPIEPKPMRCITVDSPSNLFLITRNFIPTHNTFVLTNILKQAAVKGYNCLYVTLGDVVAVTVSGPPEEKFMARKELLQVDFLVIDEFDSRYMPTGPSSDLFGRTIEDVLRRRAENQLPLLMATNSPNLLESFEGSIKSSLESLMNYVDSVPAIGKDFRKEMK